MNTPRFVTYDYKFCCPVCQGDTLCCYTKGVMKTPLASLEGWDGKLTRGDTWREEQFVPEDSDDPAATVYYGCAHCSKTWPSLEAIGCDEHPDTLTLTERKQLPL